MVGVGASLYVVEDGQTLDAAWFNNLLGDVNSRLRTIEAIKGELANAVTQLQAIGLQRIDQAVTPLIVAAQESVAAIEQRLEDVAGEIADLLAGGVPAANVQEDLDRVFVTPAQRAEFGQLRADLSTLDADIDAVALALAAINDGKAPVDGAALTNPGLGQRVAFTTTITPPVLVADQNDYLPVNLHAATHVRLSAASARILTGLDGGVEGEIKTLSNVGAGDVMLASNNLLSAFANRFALGADHVLRPGETITLRYDDVTERWRPFSNATPSQIPAGMRAQFDLPPPAPWLPLTGGTALNASYPVIAPVVGKAPGQTGVASTQATLTDAARFPGLDSSWSPFAFTIGAGFYWAVFVKAASPWSVKVFKSALPLTGWAVVATENGVNAGGGDDPKTLGNVTASRGVVWGADQGLFTLGNTLFILEAGGVTRRNDVFPDANWFANNSKLFAYGAGKWVAMEYNAQAYYNNPTGQPGSAARITTCVDPKSTWTDRGYSGPKPPNEYLNIGRLVFAFGKFVALNNINSFSTATIWTSAAGYGDWTASTGGVNTPPNGSYNWRDLVFDGACLWLSNAYNNSAPPLTRRSQDGVDWTPANDGSYARHGPLVVAQTPNWKGVIAFGYDQISAQQQSRLLSDAIVGGLTMLSPNPMAAPLINANSTATALYDGPNGRLLHLASWSAITAETMAVNPATSFVLPNVPTTPATYVYGK